MIPENILYEDEAVIVCRKPTHVATQTRNIGQKDMESMLKTYRMQKGEEPYIGVVHRLDQPVEGVMVFAKTHRSAAKLSEQIKQRTIGKHYYAIACMESENGFLAQTHRPLEGTLTDYMKTDRKKNGSCICNEGEPDAKKAQLDYKVIGENGIFVGFDIELMTGRQHQIRVQLANIGCPIWGDTKYNPFVKMDKGWQKIALCAYRLEFIHPKTKEEMQFEI